jgi:ABC-2 type transport system permease protein
MVAGVFVNGVFGYVRVAVLTSAAAAAGGSFAGYDPAAIATYTFLGQALISVVHVFAWTELSERVRTGDVAVDLARPVDLQAAWLAQDLGRAAYNALTRGVATFALGALVVDVSLPGSAAAVAAVALSVVLAVVVSFAARFLLNLAAFWTVEIRGITTFYVLTSNLLMGLVVPVQAFPGWLRALDYYATPFPSMMQAPIDVWTGRGWGPAGLGTLAVQLLWAVVLLALGRLVLARAVRRLVVQGG